MAAPSLSLQHPRARALVVCAACTCTCSRHRAGGGGGKEAKVALMDIRLYLEDMGEDKGESERGRQAGRVCGVFGFGAGAGVGLGLGGGGGWVGWGGGKRVTSLRRYKRVMSEGSSGNGQRLWHATPGKQANYSECRLGVGSAAGFVSGACAPAIRGPGRLC